MHIGISIYNMFDFKFSLSLLLSNSYTVYEFENNREIENLKLNLLIQFIS